MATLELRNVNKTYGAGLPDTLKNIEAMGVRGFVIRHREDGVLNELARWVDPATRIVNAGEAPVKRYDPGHPMADADGNVYSFTHTGPPNLNASGYSNKEVDGWLDQARAVSVGPTKPRS